MNSDRHIAIGSIHRLRAGFNSSNGCAYRRHLNNSPLCSTCSVVETEEHMLIWCPEYRAEITKLVRNFNRAITDVFAYDMDMQRKLLLEEFREEHKGSWHEYIQEGGDWKLEQDGLSRGQDVLQVAHGQMQDKALQADLLQDMSHQTGTVQAVPPQDKLLQVKPLHAESSYEKSIQEVHAQYISEDMLLQNLSIQDTPVQVMPIQELQLRHAIQKVELQYGVAHDMPVHNMLELEDLMQIDIEGPPLKMRQCKTCYYNLYYKLCLHKTWH